MIPWLLAGGVFAIGFVLAVLLARSADRKAARERDAAGGGEE